MWALINKTPYAAERSWVQDKDANKIWTIVVKATFDIQPDGSPRLADEQVPVFRMAQHLGSPGESSLSYESDLLGVKPTTDVLVRGHAWSGTQKRSSLDVHVRIGPIRKSLRVYGDRVWERTILGAVGLTPPQPFERMPIEFERAYGGWDRVAPDPAEHRMDLRNPIGTGFATRGEHCVGLRAPNWEYPEQSIRSWKDRPQPAGLNAIECHWSPRRELAGTYDDRWLQTRRPLWAEDFDVRYHNCAPPDQQAGMFLRGGEAVELINLSPSGPLAFRLPVVRPFFRTRWGVKVLEHRAELVTVVVEPDLPRIIMAWQTFLVCNHDVDELDGTTITEKRVISRRQVAHA